MGAGKREFSFSFRGWGGGRDRCPFFFWVGGGLGGERIGRGRWGGGRRRFIYFVGVGEGSFINGRDTRKRIRAMLGDGRNDPILWIHFSCRVHRENNKNLLEVLNYRKGKREKKICWGEILQKDEKSSLYCSFKKRIIIS